jgi:hypothetical protein
MVDEYDDARRERDDAMERAEKNAASEWRSDAMVAIHSTARVRSELTSEDVWESGLEKPRNPRAMGPMMTRAKKRGYIISSNPVRYKPSKLRHMAPLKVWISQVFTHGA